MSISSLEHLQVLVTGIDAAIAFDVARLVATEGASVTLADRDASRLAGLHRNIGLCRGRIVTAAVDLSDAAGAWAWGQALLASGRRPHLIVCCCGAPTGRAHGHSLPDDIALIERTHRNCPGRSAERILRPRLFLHAEPLRRSVFDGALSVLRHPTLLGLMERAGGRGDLADDAVSYACSTHSTISHRGDAPGARPGGPLRLTPDPTPTHADAA